MKFDPESSSHDDGINCYSDKIVENLKMLSDYTRLRKSDIRIENTCIFVDPFISSLFQQIYKFLF